MTRPRKIPDTAKRMYRKALALFNKGEHEKAVDCFRKAISVAPLFSNAYVELGNCYDRLGHCRSALDYYDLALEVDPENPGAWFSKGAVLQRAGHPDAALRCLERAVSTSRWVLVPQ